MGLLTGHHIHDELLQQERWVVMGSCVLFFGYFGQKRARTSPLQPSVPAGAIHHVCGDLLEDKYHTDLRRGRYLSATRWYVCDRARLANEAEHEAFSVKAGRRPWSWRARSHPCNAQRC